MANYIYLYDFEIRLKLDLDSEALFSKTLNLQDGKLSMIYANMLSVCIALEVVKWKQNQDVFVSIKYHFNQQKQGIQFCPSQTMEIFTICQSMFENLTESFLLKKVVFRMEHNHVIDVSYDWEEKLLTSEGHIFCEFTYGSGYVDMDWFGPYLYDRRVWKTVLWFTVRASRRLERIRAKEAKKIMKQRSIEELFCLFSLVSSATFDLWLRVVPCARGYCFHWLAVRSIQLHEDYCRAYYNNSLDELHYELQQAIYFWEDLSDYWQFCCGE
jgi:hypothetical protein